MTTAKLIAMELEQKRERERERMGIAEEMEKKEYFAEKNVRDLSLITHLKPKLILLFAKLTAVSKMEFRR
ncbi:MAG: hypothetical protein AB1668_02335 [Nanoarchaeota archaeon]